MPGDDFLLVAQCVDRDCLHFASALPFDDLRPRTLVDHGLVDDLNLCDVDRLVDDRGVIDDHRRGAHRFEEALLAHEYE